MVTAKHDFPSGGDLCQQLNNDLYLHLNADGIVCQPKLRTRQRILLQSVWPHQRVVLLGQHSLDFQFPRKRQVEAQRMKVDWCWEDSFC